METVTADCRLAESMTVGQAVLWRLSELAMSADAWHQAFKPFPSNLSVFNCHFWGLPFQARPECLVKGLGKEASNQTGNATGRSEENGQYHQPIRPGSADGAGRQNGA